jgi:hypothetical protein
MTHGINHEPLIINQDLAFKMYGMRGKQTMLLTQVLYTFFTGVAYLIVLSTMVRVYTVCTACCCVCCIHCCKKPW